MTRISALFVSKRTQRSMRNQSTFTTGRSAQCSRVAGNASKSSKCSKSRSIFSRSASIWPSTNSVPNANLSCSLTSSTGTNAYELNLLVAADAHCAQKVFIPMTERAGKSTSCTTDAQVIHACQDLEVRTVSVDISECLNIFKEI